MVDEKQQPVTDPIKSNQAKIDAVASEVMYDFQLQQTHVNLANIR